MHNISTKSQQYELDNYLDKSSQGAHLNGEIVAVIKEYLLGMDESLCEVIAFSIMPNHIHILLVQKVELAKIVQQIKGGLSFVLNKILKKSGALWQKDYFDKAIGDEKHFNLVYEYIKCNAIKAGLEDAENRFYGMYG